MSNLLQEYAMEHIHQHPQPNRKIEDWKYTNFDLTKFDNLDASGFTYDLANLANLGEKRLVFTNSELQEENLPSSVSVEDLNQQNLELFNQAYKDTNYMSLLASTRSLFSKKLSIAKDSDSNFNIITKTAEKGIAAKSLYLEVLEGAVSELSLLNILEQESAGLENIVIRIKPGAALNLNILHDCSGANFFSKITVFCEEDSNLHLYTLETGAECHKQEIHVYLEGSGIEAYVNGAYCLNEKDRVENFIRVHHLKGNSFSQQNFKGILDDQSRAAFDGSIFVAVGADQTNAEQLNKNLLLSEKAEVNTKPQLDIHADDVKCSHGATISRFSKDEVFYFLARGIDEDTAIDLLAKGFLNDCLMNIKSNAIKTFFVKHLEKSLKTVNESLHA